MFDYQAPEQLLEGRIILVTGAGDGIGRAAAKTYAAHGATVVLLGRTLEKLESLYDEIEAAGYPQPAIVPLNLESATEHEYMELANTLEQEFGRLDGLLNNAGSLGVRTAIETYDPTIWTQVMQVNVNAAFMLTRLCYHCCRNPMTPPSSSLPPAWAVKGVPTGGLMQSPSLPQKA